MTTYDGLTSAEVAARVSSGRANQVDDAPSRTLWDIIRGNLFTLFNAMLGTALAIVLLVGNLRDAVFGLVVVTNLLIGAFTEYRAKRTLDRLAILDRAKNTVRRDGEITKVDSADLVIDDLVLLTSGEQIPADGHVLISAGLEVDESMLTGESNPIRKAAGEELLSGSTVVGGQASYRITRVGGESYAQQLTAEAKSFSLVGSELRNAINRILVVISWIIVPIALLLFWSQIRNVGGFQVAFSEDLWKDALVQAVAGIVGMVPEGLVLLTSVNFALAALVLARNSVLVQELPAVEVLARIDTLCLDKTGTLTDGTIELVEIVPAGQIHSSDGVEPEPYGVLRALAGANDANATAAAMLPGLGAHAASHLDVLVPFSSARKWSAHSDGSHGWYFGAPDVLFGEGEFAGPVSEAVARQAAQGARVLALGYVPMVDVPRIRDDDTDALPSRLRLALLVILRERIRPDASRTLEYFMSQGVDLKIISGDNPATVAAIARAVGLDAGAGIDARRLSDEEIPEVITGANVFGRVTPHQKRAFVTALQGHGRTVAMTGDGVNDALALKDADLGIAMGTGAPATKSVARLVLLDDKFETLPGVVGQGRRVIANMERVAALFLTKTTYAVLLAVLVAMIAWPYPFLPRHLTLVGAFTIGTPAFFLALTPTNQRYRQGFLRRVLLLAIPCGIIAGTGVISVYGILHVMGRELQASTGATMVLIFMALWLLGILARPWNIWRGGLVLFMAAGSATMMALTPVREFLALEVPTGTTWLLVIGVGTLGAALIELSYRVRARRLARATDSGDMPGVGADEQPTIRYDILRSR